METLPAVTTKVPDQKTGWEISTPTIITITGTWATGPSPVASRWWGWAVAVASPHIGLQENNKALLLKQFHAPQNDHTSLFGAMKIKQGIT